MKSNLLAAGLFGIVLAAPATLTARPRDITEGLHLVEGSNRSGPGSGSFEVFGTAAQETTYFGGTFWNADSMRWEALQDSVWTFDTGVGSSIKQPGGVYPPYVNPTKQDGLHATMEGWFGVDNTYSYTPYFRRLGVSDFSGTACVGSPAGLGGDYSLWAGVLPEEAAALGYAAAQGYGNNWHACLEHGFTYGSGTVTLDFDYVNQTEPDFDISSVEVDSTGSGDWVTAVEYDGLMSGHETLNLTPGATLPSTPGDIVIRFCVNTDGVWSAEDGAYPTVCGAFAVDNVAVSGGGISYATDFETDDGGWTLAPPEPGPGGEWSDIVHRNDLPDFLGFACDCDVRDSVLVFYDNQGGHGRYQDNFAVSPWIDLKAAGLDGPTGKILLYDVYSTLPLLDYIFRTSYVRWYPEINAAGVPGNSDFRGLGLFFFDGGVPSCTGDGARLGADIIDDYSGWIPSTAERVQVGVGALSFCRFFANCTGLTNSTPWFDNVRFGVFGTPGAPLLKLSDLDLPQDAFPENGTLNPTATARVDSRATKGVLNPLALGDTLVVVGGQGGAEVRVQFAVRPGPGIDPGDLNTWLGSQAAEGQAGGLDWYSARMDTAENGYNAINGYWMTAYHEEDPNFSGTDSDRDGTDPDANGGLTRLRNDIFPDHLFTPGTRLNLFYKTRYLGGSTWFTAPDTTGGHYLEMEVLPSSMAPDTSFNCVLYVDHDGFDAQGAIETGLRTVLPDPSANYEATAWDRWDTGALGGDAEPSLGRPIHANYGATLVQMLGYKTIIWNSGQHGTYALNESDAEMLIPWFTLDEFSGNSFYASGDGFASSPGRSGLTAAATFLEDYLGVLPNCSAYHFCDIFYPYDFSDCVNLDPVTGAAVATRPLGGMHAAVGNGCPRLRSFDVIEPNPGVPTAQGDENYVGNHTEPYASISNNVPGGPSSAAYRSVVDGVSLDVRRDAGNCVFYPGSPPGALAERLTEVLSWFGAMNPAQSCIDRTVGVGVGDMVGGEPPHRTALLYATPNPLSAGTAGRIRFTLAEEARAVVTIFDLQGRRVRTVFDAGGRAGDNEAVWDGRDASGRTVSSGVYFYRLDAEGKNLSQKLVVLEPGR